MKHIRIASGALAVLLATACVTPGVTAKAATAGQEAIMEQWIEEGLLSGYEDGTLRPDATVNRAQFVHLMVELGFTGTGSTASYTDVESGAWYYSDIMSASAAGYVSGRANGSFGPRDTITRQEGIAMVARALKLTSDYTTGANENCSDWFAGEVGAIIGAGLYASGTDFTADLSRAEAVSLLNSVRNRDVEPNGGASLAIGGEVTDGSSATTATVVTGSDETITKKADKISGTVANVTISSKLGSTAYTLDDVTITGDLIIESTGDITLDNVTVKGKIIVEGSNADVILKKNAEVGDVVFHDSGSISGTNFKGTLGTVTVDTDSKYDSVTLSVKADTVNVEDQCYLYIEKNVATLNVKSGAKNATVGIDYYAKVTEANVDAAIDLYGRGDIGTLYLNASNCTISRGLDITKTTKASGVKGTSYTYNDWYWGDGWCPFHGEYDDCGYRYGWEYGYGYGDASAIINEAVSLTVDETKQLNTNEPSLSVARPITWYSDNKDVVSVDNGKLTAIAAGTATIFAYDTHDGTTVEKWSVTVSEAVATVTDVTATIPQKGGEVEFSITGTNLLGKTLTVSCNGTSSNNNGSATYTQNAVNAEIKGDTAATAKVTFASASTDITWTVTVKIGNTVLKTVTLTQSGTSAT